MKVITGQKFKDMVMCGASLLHNQHKEIDALNVFPVPDGDTGTNMSMTFVAGAKEIEKMDSDNIFDLSKKLSKGLLMGARGNSGVILSQIFRGFSMGLEGKSEINAVEMANAFKNGAEVAYKAVMRPVEGTILTVIREASEALCEYAKENMSIEEAFSYFIEAAQTSLDHTPELLPVLKDVGVVDSGGAGLLVVFHGFMAAIVGDKIEMIALDEMADGSVQAMVDNDSEEGFGYCTEFILRLEPELVHKFKEDQLKKELELLPGNSIVVVQDEEIVKVHVHTLKPGNALNIAQRFGEFIKLKIENMQEQHNSLMDATPTPVKKEMKEMALISVAAGDGIKDMFMELNCSYVVSGGQTMNPSTEDIVAAIKDVNAKNVFVLPNNSNIVMAANQAATVLEGEINVIVVPSKTIPQGLSAAIMFNPEASVEENTAEMNDVLSTVQTAQVTFAVKDTQIDGVDIKENDYMAMVEKQIVACVPTKEEAAITCLEKLLEEGPDIITLIYGEDVTEEELATVTDFLDEHDDIEVEVREGKQPVYSFLIGAE